MDPVTGAAVIMAATQLIGGLLGQSAARKQASGQMLSNIAAQSSQIEQAGIQQATQGKQSAMTNLIDSYRTALLGK